jgi:hypothetical protein
LLCAVLMISTAVWCKQVAVAAVVALPLWSLLVMGWREAVRSLVFLVTAMGVVGMAAISYFGLPALYFWLIELPFAIPWIGRAAGLARFVPVIKKFALFTGPLLAILVAVAVLQWKTRVDRGANYREWLRSQPWFLLALEGIVFAPICILAKVRTGGGSNSFTPSIYFLLLACIVAIANLAHLPDREGRRAKTALMAQVALISCALGLTAYGFSCVDWSTVRRQARHPFNNPQQVAHDYLIAHPGRAYFPWNPLAHLMAEGRLCHYAYGVFELAAAGYPLSAEEFSRGIPPNFRFVAFAPGRRNEWIRPKYLLQYSARVEEPGLPRWHVYRVPSSQGATARRLP